MPGEKELKQYKQTLNQHQAVPSLSTQNPSRGRQEGVGTVALLICVFV